MRIYLLVLPAALCFAVGSVLQQRAASHAPPEGLLRLALLGWLVRRPIWLAGTALFLLGNILAAGALSHANLALVEPLLATRLLFALPVEAAVDHRKLCAQDWGGALLAAAGISGFVIAGHPRAGHSLLTPGVVWLALGLAVLVVTGVVVAVGRRTEAGVSAPLLASGAGLLFAFQAAVTGLAVHVLRHQGVAALLATWYPWVVTAAAVYGAVLLQSAFEEAPLTRSFPPLVVTEPVAGVVIGVAALGGAIRTSAAALGGAGGALALMIAGIWMLGASPSAAVKGTSR